MFRDTFKKPNSSLGVTVKTGDPNMRDNYNGPRGQVRLTLLDKEGNTIEKREAKANLVVDVMSEVLANLISDSGSDSIVSHMAVGTDGTAATVSDTALGTEIYRFAVSGFSHPNPNETQWTATIGVGDANGNDLREVGLFNSAGSSTPKMVARFVISPEISKTAAFSVLFEWLITF